MTLTDYKSLFIYTHLYLQALIQFPSVTIQWNPGSFCWIPVPFHWNPVESSGMDAFLQESVGHQKVQLPKKIKHSPRNWATVPTLTWQKTALSAWLELSILSKKWRDKPYFSVFPKEWVSNICLMKKTTHLVMWSCEGNLKVNMLRVNNQKQANMMTYNQCYCIFFPWLTAFSKLEKPSERF